MRTVVIHSDLAPSRPRRALIGLLGALILALPAVPVAGAEPTTTKNDPGLSPSVHFTDAMAHAGDKIAFKPGGRVSVQFRPRDGDRWKVGGRAPRALPAGQASGREMAASRQGSRWASDAAPGPAPEAAPSTDPTLVPPAEPSLDASVESSPEPSAASSAEPDAASPDPTTPVDQPTVDPSEVVDAVPASAIVPTEDESVDPSAAGTLRREVFGFLPYWELSSSSTTLNYELLSTIAYFGVGVENDGDLLKRNADGSVTTGWGGWTSAKMTSVINAAHQKGTRVVLTLQKFAWSSSQASAQAALLGSATARANLARQAAAAVRDRGADGINIDFEPIASGYADEFTLLVRAIRAELDAIALGYQLTFDTTGHIGNYPIEAATAPGGADAIFVMGYDYRTAGATNAGSISPIAGPIYDLADTLAAYTARVPASKLILGVPYYGRAWSTVSDALNARNQSGTKFGASTTVIYETAVGLAAQHGRRYDPTEQAPWFAYKRQNCTTAYGCVTSWREVYYDDPQSLGAKYDLINRQGLRGAGLWALGYDGTRPELYAALDRSFATAATAAPAAPAAPAATYHALAPTRLLDSRSGNGLGGTFQTSAPRSFQVAGRGTIPSNAVAVTGNLTVTGQTAPGYITLGPSVSASPSTSTLNFPKGDNRANGVTVQLGAAGTLTAVYVAAPGSRTHLVFDVTGYFG